MLNFFFNLWITYMLYCLPFRQENTVSGCRFRSGPTREAKYLKTDNWALLYCEVSCGRTVKLASLKGGFPRIREIHFLIFFFLRGTFYLINLSIVPVYINFTVKKERGLSTQTSATTKYTVYQYHQTHARVWLYGPCLAKHLTCSLHKLCLKVFIHA